MLNEIHVKPLKLLATKIFSGAPLYNTAKLNRNSEEKGIPILNIKDIMDNQIEIGNLEKFSMESFKNAERYLAYPGDALITCRGTQLKIAVVPENLERLLITANLIAVRLGNEMLPIFLAAYLKTKEGQRSLLVNTASSTMQLVLNVSDIGEINVPVPPLSLQKKIVNLTKAAEEQYRLSIELANLRSTIINQVVTDILNK